MGNIYQEFLNSRSSIREFDPHFEISDQEIEDILKTAATAPSGNNTQPWKVVAVKSKELQKQIYELSFRQPQLESASVIFLIFGDLEAYDIDRLFAYNVENKIMPLTNEKAFKEKMNQFYSLSPSDNSVAGLMLDCGLFSMNLLHAIRAAGYEGVPMRGANFEAIKKALGIPAAWQPILMIPAGKGTAKGRKRIRRSPQEFSVILKSKEDRSLLAQRDLN